MSNTGIDLVGQLRAHLESLRAAGVRFVPRGAARQLRLAPVAAPQAPAEAPRDPLEERRTALALLEAEVAKGDRCSELFSTRQQTVFGTGPLDPEVAFVGDSPGAEEDAQGEPFVGKGGQLLGRIVAACGFTREQVYLFNLTKCRGPKNRAPTAEECSNCRSHFDKQFELVRPKHLVALGSFAARVLTGGAVPVGKLRGTVHAFRGVPLVCTFHPNEIEKDETGQRKRDTWEDMKMLLNTMGRAVPK